MNMCLLPKGFILTSKKGCTNLPLIPIFHDSFRLTSNKCLLSKNLKLSNFLFFHHHDKKSIADGYESYNNEYIWNNKRTI